MQVIGLPSHIIRNGRAASRLLAAKTPDSEAREDATPWGDGEEPWPTGFPPGRRQEPSAFRAPPSTAGRRSPSP